MFILSKALHLNLLTIDSQGFTSHTIPSADLSTKLIVWFPLSHYYKLSYLLTFNFIAAIFKPFIRQVLYRTNFVYISVVLCIDSFAFGILRF